MTRRYVRVTLTASLIGLLLGSPLAAVAPGPRLIDDGAGATRTPTRSATTAACTLEPGPMTTISVVYNAPDYWKAIATRVYVGACTACVATTALTLSDVSFRVRWISAGTAQATVSVIGGVGSGSCLVPDELQVLCPPATYTISSTGAGGIIYTLPFASGCCITKDAFVLVQFTGLFDPSQSISHGITLASGPCVPCDQYVESVSLYPTLTENCSTTLPQPYWISVDADCCTPTPTLNESWGGMKIHYR